MVDLAQSTNLLTILLLLVVFSVVSWIFQSCLLTISASMAWLKEKCDYFRQRGSDHSMAEGRKCICFNNRMWFTAWLKEKSDCFRQRDVVHNHQNKSVIVSDSGVLFTAWPREECVIVLTTGCGSQPGWKKSLIISDNEMWFITTKRRVWLFQTARFCSQRSGGKNV